jgi:hypothetical protein
MREKSSRTTAATRAAVVWTERPRGSSDVIEHTPVSAPHFLWLLQGDAVQVALRCAAIEDVDFR